MEGKTGAQDQTQVEIHRRGDDPFGQHQPGLLGERLQRPSAHLLGGARLVADVSSSAVSSDTYGLLRVQS